jgi:hypothetical protein
MNDWAEFRHFKYLLAIVEHKGFRAAAEQLHTAQPNLSAQAKQFQELSATHLFRKGKDGRIKLTETGVAFKPHPCFGRRCSGASACLCLLQRPRLSRVFEVT